MDFRDITLAVDSTTGDLIFAMPQHPEFLSVGDFELLIHYLSDSLPRLKACREAALKPPGYRSEREHSNWFVNVQDHAVINVPEEEFQPIEPEELADRIAAATGWTESRSRLEMRAGFPLTIGANLTFLEAFALHQAAEMNGLNSNMFAAAEISEEDYFDPEPDL